MRIAEEMRGLNMNEPKDMVEVCRRLHLAFFEYLVRYGQENKEIKEIFEFSRQADQAGKKLMTEHPENSTLRHYVGGIQSVATFASAARGRFDGLDTPPEDSPLGG
jgi:hypothetical protein